MRVKKTNARGNFVHYFALFLVLVAAAGFVGDRSVSASKPTNAITWDGGGLTNNWSEAANWSGDVVPGTSDDVIFDATSTKDAAIDINIAVSSIKIDTGYTGTITQSDAASIAVSGCNGRPCFEQNGGTFDGSANTITLNNQFSGGLTMRGGVFNGGSGDISLTGNPANFSLQGGTFTSTSGNLTTRGTLGFQGTSVFQPSNGTVTISPINSFSSMATDANHTSVTFNNLVFNNADGANFDIGQRVIVTGNLSLNDGTIGQNGSTLEARGGVSISPNFDGGVVTLEIVNGSGPRSFTLDSSLHLPKLVINDPNVTVNTSGSGAVAFPHQLILNAGIFNQTNDLVINSIGIGGGFCFVQNGGTFNGSGNTITLNSNGFGSIRLTGGTFNGGSGDINLVGAPADNASIILQGGTFRSTSGNLTVPGQFGFQGAGTVFLHNGGTVTLNPGQNQFFTADSNHPTINFNNLNLSPSNGVNYDFGIRAIIEGTLSLNEGSIGQNGSTIEARGDVSISPNFDGGFAALEYANGSGPRTFSFTPDLKPPKIVINDPVVTLNTSGPGTVTFPQGLILSQGTFNQNDANLVFNPPVGGGFCYLQTGGAFNGSANTLAANSNGFGSIRLTGGSFNGGSGDISLTGTGADISLQGGTFTSTSGALTVPSGFRFQGAGTVFLHNNGTVNFTATAPNFVTNDSFHPNIAFNNVNINLANGVNLGLGPVMIVVGALNLNDGSVGQAGTVVEPHGPVTVGPNFDGGPTNFQFGGASNQTFTNNGGVNPTGTWIVNKPSGIVTAATSVILQPTQQLNITSGTLFLGNGSDLTAGPITIGTQGKLAADSSQTITLGGNLINNGVVDLQGGGAGCPESDTILIRSSVPGTQRLWTTAAPSVGAFRLIDVDIQDMGGGPPITVFNGTNSGNVGPTFAFDPACPAAVSISPSAANVVTGTGIIFERHGGTGGHQFSLVVNNSGASITNAGAYVAGPILHVTDTIRVTTDFGDFAEATAFVTGPTAKMAFVQQPTTTGVGQSVSPPIRVALQDQGGFTVESATNTIVLTILNNPSGGILGGTTARNPVGGIATFDNISIGQIGSGYTLRAGTNPASIQRPTSDPFDIVAGSPTALVFVSQPQDSVTDQAISPPVQLAIVDGGGNVATNATNAVTLIIGDNPGGSTLAGSATANAVNGIATFSNLSLNNPGTGYTLTATSPTLTGTTSTPFNVVTPFTVTNTKDLGPGSLRQAILNSNSAPGLQTIDFNIPGSAPFNIALQSNLPDITDPAVIDATTQPGFAGSPVVQIDVRNVAPITSPIINPHAFKIRCGNTTVRGFCMFGYHDPNNAGSAFFIDTNGDNFIEGNWIGLDTLGNTFQSDIGLEILSRNNTIGGAQVSQRNVISGNQRSAINAESPAANTLIKGNLIGTDPTGSTARPNGFGITIANGSTVDGNVISGNSSTGVAAGPNNTISGNLIGLDANGTVSLGNGGAGVLVGNASSQVRITGNRISGNQGLGIQLGDRSGLPAVSPLPNDPQDADLGANVQQNFPILTSALTSGSGIQVSGTFNSVPERDYTIELFSSSVCDVSGNGEGETFLGSTTVTTDAGGLTGFSVTLPFVVPTGRFITATATDPGGNTSEFSNCSRVAARHTISGRITLGGQPAPNVQVAVTGPGGINIHTLTNNNGNYAVSNLPEGLAYVVTPQKAGLTFTPPQAGDNNLVTDRVIDFTAVQNRFSISGRVTANVLLSLRANGLVRKRVGDTVVQAAAPAGPFGLATVRMSLTGPTPSAFSTDFSGNYNLNGLLPGDYTLTPSKANYTFTPPSVSFTITSQNVREDFTADSPGLGLLPGRITFDTLGSIKAINANGSGLVTVVSVNRFTSFSEPRVTPDGLKVAGVSNLPANIFTANSDGTGRLNVRRASGLHSPAWSPNGSKIAFFDSVSNTLKTMNANGSGVTSVTSNCINPDWASDNTNIVCIRDRSLVTTQTGTLFNSPFNLGSPKFSPDGSKIALINGGAIEVMNSSGTGRTTIIPRDTFGSISYLGLAWSPDGTRLAFVKRICGGNGHCVKQLIAIFPTTDTSQQGLLTIDDDFVGTNIDWSESPGVSTPTGSNVTVGTGGANITFPSVGDAGSTNIVPISPASAGLLPNGFVVGSQAFDISTTANFTPLITVCFTMPSNTSLAQFNQTFLLHNENGLLVNRTSSRNFAAKEVCGQVASLSPFVLGEQVDPSLPSITGLVVDSNGNPMVDVPVLLTGAEDRTTTTDVNGEFAFANLTAGENCNAQPKLPGFLFTEYSQDFLNVSNENSVVFTGTPATFGLGGRVTDQGGNGLANVSLSLSGSATDSAISDANGNYSFADLPADGIYSVSASNGVNIFSPGEQTESPLVSDVSGLDFIALTPTAAHVAISGQVVSSTGAGISGAVVSLMDARGQVLTSRTGTFGYFTFDSVLTGEGYLMNVSSRRYRFEPRLLSVNDSVTGLKIVGVPF